MQVVQRVLHAMVPASLALSALLQARGIGELVLTKIDHGFETLGLAPRSLGATARIENAPNADPILARNPFDHVTGSLLPNGAESADDVAPDVLHAPPCAGTRPLFLVKAEDPDASIAALEVNGQRVLRRRGGEVAGMHVAYIGVERVWLEGEKGLCQAGVFTPAVASQNEKPADKEVPRGTSALERDIGAKIERTGATDFVIDRGTLERIFESQGDLSKPRLIAEKDGDRVVGLRMVGVKPGSVVAKLGLENGDRLETLNGFDVSSPEKMFEAYARIRAGADRIAIRVTRAGRTMDLVYAVR